MTEKRFIYCEKENGEFPFPYIEYDGKNIISLYECYQLLNELNDEVVKRDLFKLTVAMAIQHRINWLKKQLWDNTDRIDELQSLKKELKL